MLGLWHLASSPLNTFSSRVLSLLVARARDLGVSLLQFFCCHVPHLRSPKLPSCILFKFPLIYSCLFVPSVLSLVYTLMLQQSPTWSSILSSPVHCHTLVREKSKYKPDHASPCSGWSVASFCPRAKSASSTQPSGPPARSPAPPGSLPTPTSAAFSSPCSSLGPILQVITPRKHSLPFQIWV